MPVVMTRLAVGPGRPKRWVVWCAALLIAAGILASLHAATPHAGAQRHCAVCVALHSPSAAPQTAAAQHPRPPSSPLRPAPAESIHSHDEVRPQSGRAPPATV
jgi:hypothetical protein